MKRWDEAETIRLQQEAERRARAGQWRTDISRELGVPLHTLSRWAFAFGWREKDIRAERAAQQQQQQPQQESNKIGTAEEP
jgi:hypothetical protein